MGPIELELILIAVAAFIVAGTIKGIIGLGLPLTSVAIISSFLPLTTALAIVVIPVLVLNMWQAAQGLDFRIVFRRLFLLNLFACIGIALGAYLLVVIDIRILTVLLGIAIGGYVLIDMFHFRLDIAREREAPWAVGLGFAGGVLCGATGSLAAPVILFLHGIKLERDAFVQAIGMVFFITSFMWAAALIQNGIMTWETSKLSAAAILPAAAGMIFGTWVRSKIPPERFRKLVMGFLFLLALNLIRKGLM